jgi:hypothetical protein
VFHSGPGNAFAIDDKHRDRRELLKAQAIIKDRCSRDFWQLLSVFHTILSVMVCCDQALRLGTPSGLLCPL